MCGRFTLSAKAESLTEMLPGLEVEAQVPPRYNIAPSQPVATVLNDGKKQVVLTRWGLVPSWAKDPEIGSRLINARAETLHEKPSFRHSFKRRRCLILADGFYEWQRIPGRRTKKPMYFRMKSGEVFAFAGLWDEWCDKEGGVLVTSVIVTTPANELVSSIHDRMPAILVPGHCEQWLSPDEQKPEQLRPCLQPYPAGEMETYEVSPRVNSTSTDDPECVRPVGEQDELDLFSL